MRSHRVSFNLRTLFHNPALNVAVVVVLALQAGAIYLPWLSDTVLELRPLRLIDWGVAVAAGVLLVVLTRLRMVAFRPAFARRDQQVAD